MKRHVVCVLILALALSHESAVAGTLLHHRIDVVIDPESRSIDATDSIELMVPDEASAVAPAGFFLREGLEVDAVSAGGQELRFEDDAAVEWPHQESSLPGGNASGPARPFRFVALRVDEQPTALTVRYQGEVFDALSASGEEYARSFESTTGLVDTIGVYLSGATGWLPTLPDAQVTFELTVHLPAGWRAVSQGIHESRDGADVWTCTQPQEEVYVVAGRYAVAAEPHGDVLMQTYTYAEDPELTGRYLEATASYLDMYGELLTPYPYAKFAMVENFWQSGYGMPSFTLLGDQIIRMPWIISTSYGHEILHNWFGNGVYVDWQRGNWCEGLTTYLADHLYKEQQGQGATYRRQTLRAYRDFVRDSNDLALLDFRTRYDPVTQAVGYGKTMMVFHMLRGRLGDEVFLSALRRFIDDQMFEAADWSDLEAAFESESGKDLGWFFEQWVTRPGAPDLALSDVAVSVTTDDSEYQLAFDILERSSGDYRLRVPVVVTLEGREAPVVEVVEVAGTKTAFQATYDARPLYVAVDPAFDAFRRIERSEIPPALGELFGAEVLTIVIPTATDADRVAAYRELAAEWSRRDGVRVVDDVDAAGEASIDSGAVWVLGAENRLAAHITAGVWADGDSIALGGRWFPKRAHSFVFAAHPDGDVERTWGFVHADGALALPGLARKLPHYRKYSYLAFQGDEPSNVHKGEWAAEGSPLVRRLSSVADVAMATPLPPPPAAPLIERQLAFDTDKLAMHAAALCDPAMEGRGLGTAGIDRAADYIAGQLRLAGLLPGGDDGYFQTWTARGGPDDAAIELRNVIGILPGSDPARREECVVVGAHYDHLGHGWPDVHAGDEGVLHPGADDNASGVAVALELARIMASSSPPSRNVLFAFFTGEEAELLGSRYYVDHPVYALSRTVGVVNLDTVGRLGERKLLVFGAESTREMPHVIRGAGYVTGVPAQMSGADMGSSDQLPFHERGVPAIQLFTGPHTDYHRPGDTVDQLDTAGMAKIATFTRESVNYLAGRDGPMQWVLDAPAAAWLTATAAAAATPARSAASSDKRRVSLGSIPDFSYADGGVRLEGTVPGSPANAAGLEAGDIIVALGEKPVLTLRDLSDALKAHAPGDRVNVVFTRDGDEHTVPVELVAR